MKKKENNTVSSIIEEYKKHRPTYDAFTKKVEALVKTLIEETDLKDKVHEITSRTKKIDKFSEKVSRAEKSYKVYTDVTDLSGVRIICYFSKEVDKLAEVIRNNFTVIPEHSVDKRQTLDPDRFGYISLHLVVKLSNERAKLPEYEKYKDLLCEVQIRSVLQHAWAEIEYDLGYKIAIELPRKTRRRFCRLAGLLELADEEFDNIRFEIKEYSGIVEEKIEKEPEELLIDKISLASYIEKSSIVKEIENAIVIQSGESIREKTVIYPHWLKALDYVEIKTIDTLNNLLKKNKEELIKYDLELKKISPYHYGPYPRGWPILSLTGYLMGKSDDMNQLDKFVKIVWDTEEIRRNFPKHILEATRKIQEK